LSIELLKILEIKEKEIPQMPTINPELVGKVGSGILGFCLVIVFGFVFLYKYFSSRADSSTRQGSGHSGGDGDGHGGGGDGGHHGGGGNGGDSVSFQKK